MRIGKTSWGGAGPSSAHTGTYTFLLKLRFVAIDFKKNTTVNMGCLQTRTVTE